MIKSWQRVSKVLFLVAVAGCHREGCTRPDPDKTSTVVTGEFGGPGDEYTVQCSGWYPDWIVPTAEKPQPGEPSFQLSQGFWLGVPILQEVDGKLQITGYNPPSPLTGGPLAPWLDIDYTTNPQGYLDAMKAYLLEGMIEADFVAQKNRKRSWYHVPMMTGREPHRGLTVERRLQNVDHEWITSGSLGAYAIGYYNHMGSYTLGQVFRDIDPQKSDPTKARFIQGTFVFKLLFAEYDEAKIDTQSNPLDGSSEWMILDPGNKDNGFPPKQINVRLLQVDVAAKDERSPTGWVFGTFVYDKTRPEPSPWAKLTPVGLQWGNDPSITTPADGPIVESEIINQSPGAYGVVTGRHGRLNGPVDNPVSSCLSCHSTAQVDTDHRIGQGNLNGFLGVHQVGQPGDPNYAPRRTAPPSCTPAQQMQWFRNVPAGNPWGVQSTCDVNTGPQPNLVGLDYSLQLTVGLQSALFFRNRNPCAELDPAAFKQQALSADPDKRSAAQEIASQRQGLNPQSVQDAKLSERLREFTPRSVGLVPEPQR